MNPSLVMLAFVVLIVIVIVFVWAANRRRDRDGDRERPQPRRRPRRRPDGEPPVEPPTQVEGPVRYSTGRTALYLPLNLSHAIAVGYRGNASLDPYKELSVQALRDLRRIPSTEVDGLEYGPSRPSRARRLQLSLTAQDSHIRQFRGQLYRRVSGSTDYVPIDGAYVEWNLSGEIRDTNVSVDGEVDLNFTVETTDRLILLLIYRHVRSQEEEGSENMEDSSVRVSGQLEFEP